MSSKLDRIDPKSLQTNPRASMSSWLRYEPIVQAAFAHHPKPYVYSPTNRSANTVVSQMRDAVRGCLAFTYPSQIPHPDLLRWYSEVIFKSNGKQVYIGPPEEISESIEGVGNVDKADTTFRYPELSFEEVNAFTLLLSTGRLLGPVIILHPPDLSLLPERQNVERLPRPDGSLVLL